MMKGLPIILALFWIPCRAASAVPPRELGLEITNDILLTSVQNAAKQLPQNSPLAKATIDKDSTGEIITIKDGEFELLTVRKPAGSRQIVLSNRANPQMRHNSFEASFTALTTIKTPEELDKEILKRLTSFNGFLGFVITYIDTYKDAGDVLKKVQTLLAKNSNGAIKEDSFAGVLSESIKKKTPGGLDYTINESTVSILGQPGFIKISVSHFGYKSYVFIDLPNFRISAMIVPTIGDAFENLEKKIQKMFASLKLNALPNIENIVDIINTGIGKCAKFTKSKLIDTSAVPYFQYLDYTKEIKVEEISAEDSEGFRSRVRKLLDMIPPPSTPRRLDGDIDCRIHEGHFEVMPIILKTFPYIQIKYNSNDLYINEQFIQISEKSVFDPKIKQFVEQVNKNMDIINGKKESKDEVPKETWKEPKMVKHILDNTKGLSCSFTEASKLEVGKKNSCSSTINGKKTEVLFVTHFMVGSNDFYEITMIEPNIKGKPPKAVQTMTYGLDQTKPSFDILAENLKNFVANLGK